MLTTVDQDAILREVEIISPQTDTQDQKYAKAIQTLCKRGVLWKKGRTGKEVGFTPKGFQLASLCFQESRLQYPVVNMCMEHQLLSRLEGLFPYSSKAHSSTPPISPSRNSNPPLDSTGRLVSDSGSMHPEMRDVDYRKRSHTAVDPLFNSTVVVNTTNTVNITNTANTTNTTNTVMGRTDGRAGSVASPLNQNRPTTEATLYLPRLTWPLAPPSKHQHFGEMSTILEEENKENGEEELEEGRYNRGDRNRIRMVSANKTSSGVQANDPTACIISTTMTNPRAILSQSQNARNEMDLENRVLEGQEEEWEVFLLLDSREVRTQQDRSFLHNHLQLAGVSCDVRSLGLGDMQWIARRGATGQEVMLSTIVERKNTRDFAQSILDGRFDEQQYRLMNCGCKHPIYLIEGSLRSQDVLSPDKLQSDIMTTVVNRNLYVYMSTSIDDTIVFLKGVHERVKDSFHRYFALGDE